MDIEKLSKTQIVLLTLLISFVTSIATGIVTITLMDQTPPAIVQTIHKVVERTVETVVPRSQQLATVSKEIVVIKEKNIIAGIVKNNRKAFVRIMHSAGKSNKLVSFGVIVNKDGILITGSKNIVKGSTYNTVFNKKDVTLKVLKIDNDKGVAFLEIVDKKNDSSVKKNYSFINLAKLDSLELGQSVVALGGKNSEEIYTGIISGFLKSKVIPKILEGKEDTASIFSSSTSAVASDTEVTKDIKSSVGKTPDIIGVKTNILKQNLLEGEPLFNLEGNVVGINIDSSENSFISLNFVKKDISEIINSKSKDK